MPPQADLSQHPGLARVNEAFVRVVAECRASTDEDWYTGWMGNAWVNFRRGSAKGLCYHWQSVVFDRVKPVAQQVGLDATGLSVHTGTGLEHHVVIVFDPTRIAHDDLLTAPPPRAAFVLDAWRRGRPDLFDLDRWLERDAELTETGVLETPEPWPPAETEVRKEGRSGLPYE